MSWPALACPDQLGGSPERPVLLGNRCRNCGEPFFPARQGCTRCSGTELDAFELGSEGKLWSWTVQMFLPKAPYDGDPTPESFRPYGVGYVELPCGLKVESRLAAKGEPRFAIGQPMRLVLQPYRKDAAGQDVYTYAFEALS
jgi:uncharacterized OB-fold protein